MLQKGFTLIELMIVVAIIGILSMFALPAYQDYTKRTYVSEGMALSTAAKMASTEYFSTQGEWPANNAKAGLPAADKITGQAVAGIGLYLSDYAKNASGTATGSATNIVIYYNSKVVKSSATVPGAASSVATSAAGSLTLAPVYSGVTAGSVEWACRKADGAIMAKWLPANCRDQELKNANTAGK